VVDRSCEVRLPPVLDSGSDFDPEPLRRSFGVDAAGRSLTERELRLNVEGAKPIPKS
jgi:hypothetical protein